MDNLIDVLFCASHVFTIIAEQSGELYIGDAILKVNDIDITQLTHDQAVHILKTTNASNNSKLLGNTHF